MNVGISMSSSSVLGDGDIGGTRGGRGGTPSHVGRAGAAAGLGMLLSREGNGNTEGFAFAATAEGKDGAGGVTAEGVAIP